MKAVFFLLALAATTQLYGQSDDYVEYYYGSRSYQTTPCCDCGVNIPGEKADKAHPYSEFLNDESLWYWADGPMGTKVYDLKQE